MSDPFIGQVTMFAGTFAPSGWAFCSGQLLPIAQYSALFSILGTTYGGDGETTFGLPDLRGRSPVGSEGNQAGPGLNVVPLGAKGGTVQQTLAVNQMPAHTHPLACNTGRGNNADPEGNYPADANRDRIYSDTATAGKSMGANAIGSSGSGQPFDIRNPYLGINFIIAMQGIFPSPN